MTGAVGLVREVARDRPFAVRLAEAVSLAVLVDPILLRRARRLFVPEADAGTEADLWLSPLVSTRGRDGIVFPSEVAEELRLRLRKSGRLEEAWEMTKELHSHLSPALKLEEEIAWLSVSRDPGAAERIEELLHPVLRAIVVENRRGLAHWAARAMSALPSKVREKSEAARMLKVGAHLRLDGNAAPACSQEGAPDWLSWVAPADLPYVRVRVRLFHGEVEIDSVSTEEGNLLQVPETTPLLIDLMWEASEKEEKRVVQVTLRKGEVVPVPIEAREVRLRTVLGEVYSLRPTSGFSTYRSMAPPRQSFVHRDEYDRIVKALLTASQGDRVGTVGITAALRGAGGFGKTALAIEVCWDERVQRAYPDGILWITMGESLEASGRLAKMRELIRWWIEEEPPAFETVTTAGLMLRELLTGKRVLLVIDDVWRPEDVELFWGLGPGSALLVTTRDSRTLPPEGIAIEIDVMSSAEAMALLGAGLPVSHTTSLSALAARLGEWPLLLNIVNRQLRELIEEGLTLEQALREIEEALQAEGLTAFDPADFDGRALSVARVLNVSLARLSSKERDRYGELAIFPEDVDVPLSILERFWRLSSHEVRRFCDGLHNISLLLRFDRAAGTIRLHDVVRAYLLKRGGDLAPVHQRLLTATRPASGRWPDLPKEETYLWGNLFHHLAGSGEIETCRNLLLDFTYLQAKLEATNINALLADFALFAEEDSELRIVADALRLSADILATDQKRLLFQLLDRLGDREEPGIRRLLRGIRNGNREAILEYEDEMVRHSRAEDELVRLGLRSFVGWGGDMERRNDHVLDLVEYFQGRYIKEKDLWEKKIFPNLREFLLAWIDERRPLLLDLATHSSIAFAAGWVLEPKSGLDIRVRQRIGGEGELEWHPKDGSEPEGTLWLDRPDIVLHPEAPDVVLALGVSQPAIVDEVQEFIRRRSLHVGRIVDAAIAPEPGPRSVKGGAHALRLAQTLLVRLRQKHPHEREGRIHLFCAAPNALVFYLGQLAPSLGKVVLYEYAFGTKDAYGRYQKTIELPPSGSVPTQLSIPS